jgi:hypothetical protein
LTTVSRGRIAVAATLLGFLLMAIPWVAHLAGDGFEALAVTAGGLLMAVFGVALAYETIEERARPGAGQAAENGDSRVTRPPGPRGDPVRPSDRAPGSTG